MIHGRLVNRLIFLGIVLAMPLAAMGQVITGNIDGTVRDASGGVLPGATLTLSSPQLPSGPQVFVSDAEGRYRFRNLPPGIYSLDVEMPGFATYREEGLKVVVGGHIERNLNMQVASVAETITVTGESPIVDTRKSGLSTNYDESFMENTPLRRFSMFDFTKSAPGMSGTNPTSGTSTRVSAYGSSVDENTYLMDGTDFTAPVSGAAWPWPDTDTIEEIEIVSLGASAEFMVGGGAVFNAVTKQGTNDLRVDGSYFGMFDSLTSKPIKVGCGGCPDGDSNGETGFTRDKYVDFTTHVGLPIVKDKVWLYAGYQYLRDYDNQPGADPRFPRKFEADRVNYKFTWQVTENMKFMSTYHDDYWVIPQTPSVSAPFESILTFSGHNPSITFGDITHVLSPNTFYDVRVSGFYSPSDTGQPNGNFGQSRHEDIATGVISGGPPFSGGFHQARTAVHGKLSHYASDFIGADHDFKFGVQYVNGKATNHYGYTNDIIYYDYNSEPYYAYTRERYDYGGKFTDTGFFAEDMIHLGDRATVQIGVRYDRVEAISQDISRLDQDLKKVGTVKGLGSLYTNNNVAPRIGFNVKLDEAGKTVVRGNWGLYFRQPITGEFDDVHPGQTPISRVSFNPATGAYDIVDFTTDVLKNKGVSPDTKSPKTSQFSIGVDHELSTDIAVGFTYIRKDGSDYNGWIVQNAQYGRQTVTLDDGRQIEAFNILTDPSDRFFLMGDCPCGPDSLAGNFSDFFLNYDGVQVQMTKRMANHWQAIVAYNYSNGRGLIGSNSRSPSSSQESRVRSGRNGTIGQDPNDFTNATGNLLNDRTHTFTLTGAYEIPNIELLIGANYRYFTGKPYASQANVGLDQGTKRVYLEPLGSRRLSSQSQLDLRISKIFRFGGTGKFEILTDILNLLNDTSEEAIVTRNFFSDNFASPNRWVDPRRAFIGIKLSY